MNLLASKNLANGLVLVITIYLTIAMLWPQNKMLDSPALLGLGLLFFINLSACTLKLALSKPKGRRLGLLIFHGGLITLLIGMGLNHFWGGEGLRYLGVDQEIPLAAREIREWKGGFLAKDWDSGYTIKLTGARVEMEKGEVHLRNATLQYYNNEGQVAETPISFLSPLDLGGARIRVRERGFAPILDWGMQVIQWTIPTQRHLTSETYRGKLTLGENNLSGEYFPAGQDGRKGKLVVRVQEQGSWKTFTLKPGDSFTVNGQKVVWQDTGYWLLLSFTVEPGLWWVVVGTLLILGGNAYYYLPLLWKREKNV